MNRKILTTTALLLTLTPATLIGTSHANAARRDGIVQPGDVLGGCTAGPIASGYIFSAQHCGTGTKSSDAGRLAVSGSSPYYDTLWVKVPPSSSTAISTSTTSTEDIPTTRLLQPWAGMTVSKSGKTSGVTSGTLQGVSPSDKSLIAGMQQCKGDSGAVAYTNILGLTYVVGMVTHGNGSGEIGQQVTDQVCKDPLPPRLTAGMRDIDQMCKAAQLADCRNEAGAPLGALEDASVGVSSITASGWVIDPSSPATPLSVRILVDGVVVTTALANTDRPDLVVPLMLDAVRPGGTDVGFTVEVPVEPGLHTVCADAANIGEGVDQSLTCRQVTVPSPPPTTPPPVRTGPSHDDLLLTFPLEDGFGQYNLMQSTGSSFDNKGNAIGGRGVQRSYAGDFNGDGRDDLLIAYEQGGPGTFANYEVFTATDTGFNAGKLWISPDYFGLVPQIVVGNFNGTDDDGVRRDDLMLVYPLPNGFGEYHVMQSTGSSFESKGGLIGGRGVQRTYAGDFNGDGRDDVLLAYEQGGPGTFANYEVFTAGDGGFNPGELWISPDYFGLVPQIVVGNFNGTDNDGARRDDVLLIFPLEDGFGQYNLMQSTGSSFDNKGNAIGGRGVQRSYAGDFNGDGRDDLLIAYEQGGPGTFANYEVFTATDTGFNAGKLWISPDYFGLVPQIVVGNFNGTDQ